jgi:hypothetical protein
MKWNGGKIMRIQKLPNLIRGERRLCLTRIRWETGKVGDGKGYSNKVSISLQLKWPPLRIHRVRSYGGVFP